MVRWFLKAFWLVDFKSDRWCTFTSFYSTWSELQLRFWCRNGLRDLTCLLARLEMSVTMLAGYWWNLVHIWFNELYVRLSQGLMQRKWSLRCFWASREEILRIDSILVGSGVVLNLLEHLRVWMDPARRPLCSLLGYVTKEIFIFRISFFLTVVSLVIFVIVRKLVSNGSF